MRLRLKKLKGKNLEIANQFGIVDGDWVIVDRKHFKQGLGDKAEKIFKPIAKFFDRLLGTKLAKCKGCKKRKDFLNGKTL